MNPDWIRRRLELAAEEYPAPANIIDALAEELKSELCERSLRTSEMTDLAKADALKEGNA
jgi:hypothetical protein